VAIWQAKTADGARIYWKVVIAGQLKAGLEPGDFTALVIAPDDSDSLSVSVAESTQQAGVYYADVASAFLKSNGNGIYGFSVGVHTDEVDSEVLHSLLISDYDITDIAKSGQRLRWR